ncbi:MAG: inositol monophosphatase family protein, partial [Bacteriovoracia bacterium]
EPSKKELINFLKFTEKISLQSGKLLLKYRKNLLSLKVFDKKAQGLVSEADLASEKKIIAAIKKSYPNHQILAEEESYNKDRAGKESHKHYESTLTWIIDPLDGTNNFLSGMDYFGISMALTLNGKPLVAVVYRPATDECFSAYFGGGCFKKSLMKKSRPGKLYASRNKKKLTEGMLVTGFNSEKGVKDDKEFHVFRRAVQNTRGVRRMGSAALDMCYVAQGIFDGFWEEGLSPWDVAAGSLIATESGVKVGTYTRDKVDLFAREILVARSPFNIKIRELIKRTS